MAPVHPSSPQAPRHLLGVFRRPLWRDWTFWLGVGLAIGLFCDTAFGSRPTGQTHTAHGAVDGLEVAVVGFLVFGMGVAGIRRLLGVALSRRRSAPATTGLGTLLPEPQYASAPSASASRPSGVSDEIDADRTPAGQQPATSGPTPRGARQTAAWTAATNRSPQGASPMGQPAAQAPQAASPDAWTAESAVLRDLLPHPLARALRLTQQQHDALEEYKAILEGAEYLMIVLGITGLAWLRNVGRATPGVPQFIDSFERGTTAGAWLALATDIARGSKFDWTPNFEPYRQALRLQKGVTGLETNLRLIVQERNRWAHLAGPRNVADAERRLDEFLRDAWRSAIAGSRFLADTPWFMPTHGAYRAKTHDFAIQGLSLIGEHPDFDPHTLLFKTPLEDNRLVALAADEELRLWPLCQRRPCAKCQQDELFYVDGRASGKSISLKSLDRGHSITTTDTYQDVDEALAEFARLPIS